MNVDQATGLCGGVVVFSRRKPPVSRRRARAGNSFQCRSTNSGSIPSTPRTITRFPCASERRHAHALKHRIRTAVKAYLAALTSYANVPQAPQPIHRVGGSMWGGPLGGPLGPQPTPSSARSVKRPAGPAGPAQTRGLPHKFRMILSLGKIVNPAHHFIPGSCDLPGWGDLPSGRNGS
jgi:hypothetical protein